MNSLRKHLGVKAIDNMCIAKTLDLDFGVKAVKLKQ